MKIENTKPTQASTKPEAQSEISKVAGELFSGHKISWFKVAILGPGNLKNFLFNKEYAQQIKDGFYIYMRSTFSETRGLTEKDLDDRIAQIPPEDMTEEMKGKLKKEVVENWETKKTQIYEEKLNAFSETRGLTQAQLKEKIDDIPPEDMTPATKEKLLGEVVANWETKRTQIYEEKLNAFSADPDLGPKQLQKEIDAIPSGDMDKETKEKLFKIITMVNWKYYDESLKIFIEDPHLHKKSFHEIREEVDKLATEYMPEDAKDKILDQIIKYRDHAKSLTESRELSPEEIKQKISEIPSQEVSEANKQILYDEVMTNRAHNIFIDSDLKKFDDFSNVKKPEDFKKLETVYDSVMALANDLEVEIKLPDGGTGKPNLPFEILANDFKHSKDPVATMKAYIDLVSEGILKKLGNRYLNAEDKAPDAIKEKFKNEITAYYPHISKKHPESPTRLALAAGGMIDFLENESDKAEAKKPRA